MNYEDATILPAPPLGKPRNGISRPLFGTTDGTAHGIVGEDLVLRLTAELFMDPQLVLGCVIPAGRVQDCATSSTTWSFQPLPRRR